MLINYLQTALRNISKYKLYSFLNITGLALGLSSFIVIFLYVQGELSCDKYNENYNNIFRVVRNDYARTPAPLAEALRNEFPEITNTVRIAKADKAMMSVGKKSFYEENIIVADPSIFNVFTFPLIDGDPNTALSEPLSILLTQEAAGKYFGNTNPVGRLMRFDNKYDLKVTGVMKDVSPNSHFHFDFLISMSSTIEIYGKDFLTNTINTTVYTYLLLNHPTQADNLQKLFPAFIKKYYDSLPFLAPPSFIIQPLSRIHLYSDFGGEMEPNGDIQYVIIFSGVGFLILLMACINYMNILSARYADRIKEIGVRKVLGADRMALVKQFVGESVLTAALSMAVAVTLVELVLPIINSSMTLRLDLILQNNFEFDILLVAVTLLTGMISASYPALVLSSFRPSEVLRKSLLKKYSGTSMMRVLIVLQFFISTGLIISTALISEQLNFIQYRKLGLDKEQVIILPLREENTRKMYRIFKNQLLMESNIISASASSVLPGEVEYYTSVYWAGSGLDKTMDFIFGDYDFIRTYKIELADGRDFSKSFAGDLKGGYILNESAVKEIGWKQAIGQKFTAAQLHEGTVVGVVKDFNYRSLREKIKPLFIAVDPDNVKFLSVRVGPEDIPSTLASIHREWNRIFPQSPFEYSFFDAHLDNLYKSENRLGEMFNWFSCLAIIIACLGVFGLSFISTARRGKEIGIRKVLGAPVVSIVGLVSKEFLILISIANIIAWPIAWYVMNNWLQAFAYKIDPGIWLFATVSFLIVVTAMMVVVVQSMRAATANPVESLWYE